MLHSYQTLAVLALAVSTASPAISAPIRYAPCFSTLRTVLSDAVILLLGNRPAPSLTVVMIGQMLKTFSRGSPLRISSRSLPINLIAAPSMSVLGT